MIIHYEVTDESDDRRQLYPMAHQTKVELDQGTLSIHADAGYSNGEQLAVCDAEGIAVTLHIRRSIIDLVDAYPKSAFVYDADEEALQALRVFAERWDNRYPQISKSWHKHLDNLNTLLNYPPDIRKAIYTTNAIESLNSVIRKATKKRKLFPGDVSVKMLSI